MATNTVTGLLTGPSGTIPLEDEIAEGTEAEVKTDATYTGGEFSIGDFAPGFKVTHAGVQADNGISYSYVLRQGQILCHIPVSLKGVAQGSPLPLIKPIVLQAGDQLKVLTLTASARNASVSYYTNKGVARIAIVTPSGGATNEFVDLQTGNSLGATVQGQAITLACCTSLDGAKIESPGGGAFVTDAVNNVVGGVPAQDPAKAQPMFGPVSIPVDLNYSLYMVTNA